MSNWDRVKELTEESANAAGTADEKYTAYMDSMEAATKRLQNAWEGFTQSLETSTVLKGLTNATAILVENMDKLKYLVTVIAAASSAKIFDFFTNKGETGGFKGLIANIPFIGRGTKTNNILENIDKKVGNIERGVGADSLANQTKNSGWFKRIGSFFKTGFGRGDIYDPKTGKSMSYKDIKEYNFFKGSLEDIDPQKENFAKLLKQRQIQNATMGAISAVVTNLFTTKQVGAGQGGIFDKALGINKAIAGGSEQTVEETSGDKAARVLASGGLAVLGGAIGGPLGAMLGQTLGEDLASMFSTWLHRDELEMKQRVADAKERYNQLKAIQTSVDNISTDLGTGAEDYETYQKRKEEVTALKDTVANEEDDVKNRINAAVKELGYDSYDVMLEALLDTSKTSAERAKIKNEFQTIIARERANAYNESLEIEFNKMRSARDTLEGNINGGADWFKYASLRGELALQSLTSSQTFQKAIADAKARGILTDDSYIKNTGLGLVTEYDLQVAGQTSEEKLANFSRFADLISNVDVSKILQDLDWFDTSSNRRPFKSLLDSIVQVANETVATINDEQEIKSEWRKEYAAAGVYGSGLALMKPSQLKELGMEGAIQEVADQMESDFGSLVGELRDESGDLLDSVYSDIKAQIKESETLYNNLVLPQGSIKDWEKKSEELKEAIQKLNKYGIETENDLKDAAEKGGESFKELANNIGMTTIQLRSLINLGSSDYFAQMAEAIDLTESELKGFVDEVKGLDKVSFSAFTYNVSQLTEKFDLMRKLYLAAVDGSWAGDEELLSEASNDDFVKNFITNINDVAGTAKELGEILYSSGQSLERFLLGFASFAEIKTSGTQMEGFLNYLKEVEPELKDIVVDMNNLQEVLDYIAMHGDKSEELLQRIKEYVKTQEITRYNEDLQKGIDAITKSNEKQIENLQQQKDALSQINDEREKEFELIKAKEALESAKKERKRVYRAGVGFVYETDEEAITEAQQKLDELDVQKQQDLIQSQIDALEQQNSILETLPDAKEMEELNSVLKDLVGGSTSVAESIVMLVDKYNNPNYSFDMGDFIDTYLKNSNLSTMYGAIIDDGDGRFTVTNYDTWETLFDEETKKVWDELTNDQKLIIKGALAEKEKNATGTESFTGGATLINELGTEAIITPGGTLTALPSKTGIVPADITKNLWSLGEVAPTLVAQLSSLNQKALAGNAGNTTYEEGQYFDNFTMNVYPTKDYDMEKLLSEARAKVRLTRHNN